MGKQTNKITDSTKNRTLVACGKQKKLKYKIDVYNKSAVVTVVRPMITIVLHPQI